VIIPVYNGAQVIGRCLDALAAQQPADPTLEVIVIDDGSRDETVAFVERWGNDHPALRLRVASQPNAGPASARNHGARLATGDLLLFTDADCIPSATWVDAFRRAFEAPAAPDAAMGAYTCALTTPAARYSQLEFEERYALMARQPALDFIATYSAAYLREVFLAAGGFDASFPKANNEDAEFSYRLSDLGYRLGFVPDARVQHEHDETWQSYLRTKIGRGYWRTIVYRRFPGKGIKDSYTPQVLKAQLPLSLLALAGVAAALLGRSPRRLALAIPFLLSTAPMTRFAVAHPDPAMRATAPWVPWGSLVRALAFVVGVSKALLVGGTLPTAREGALSRAALPAPEDGEAVP
jgi:glycosyltransferase involved in cell wall biosynthesis